MQTPVAFIIFNRPAETARVFAAIRAARPRRLLVVADGPRQSRAGEAELCAAARAVIDGVDWPCDVQANFADTNLGCKNRVSSGLDWVFGECEEAVIIEDDCLPHPTFFRFCEELLAHYRDDNRVAMISGSNFLRDTRQMPPSYYFSLYGHIWGWASWRNRWQNYDVEMRRWRELRRTDWLENLLQDKWAVRDWRGEFDAVTDGRLNTWDHQWRFAWWVAGQYAVAPSANLISNLGFGAAATHTGDMAFAATMANLPTQPMEFPLRHPDKFALDREAERYTFRQLSPWAVPAKGLQNWLRFHLGDKLPKPLRRAISFIRRR
jgi:hypothetical protein